MDRPLGVSLVAGLAAVFGVLYFGLGLLALSGPLSPDDATAYGLTDATTLAMLTVGVALLAFAFGGWMERVWSWFVGVGVCVVGLVAYVYRLSSGGANSGSFLAILVFAVILAYLVLPGTRRAFHLARPRTEVSAS